MTVAAYAPTVDGPFIWDDRQLILNSARITELRPLREYFGTSFWVWADLLPGGRSYYRPLSTLSFALDHYVHGENAGGFHLTNQLLHAANALLLFALLRKCNLYTLAAGLLALAWSLFPRLTEAAAWISGRTDVLATFFVLLSLWLSTRKTWFGRCASGISLLLALLAKEVAAAGLVGVAMYEWRSSAGLRIQRRVVLLTPYLTAAMVYAAMRSWAIGAPLQDNGLTPIERVGPALEAAGRYVWMLLDGWHPSIQIGRLDTLSVPFVLLGTVATLAAALATWRVWPRLDALSACALATLLGSIGLVLHIVPITVNIVAADRFLYLPLTALCLLLALPARRLPVRPFCTALALLVVSYAGTTFARCRVWGDEVEFWLDAVRSQREYNAMSRLELGNVYGRAGLFTYALGLYMDADTHDFPNFLLSRHNAGTALLALGRYPEATAMLEEVVQQAPGVAKFQIGLASSLVATENVDQAKKHVGFALRLQPDSVGAQHLQSTIAELERTKGTPLPDESTSEGRLALVNRKALLGRSKEALDLLAAESAAKDFPLSKLEAAIPYAFGQATPHQLSAIFKRYTELGGNSLAVREAYEERMQRVRRLRELWPTLSKYRSKRAAR